jgi:proline iminopeptidase
MVIYIITKMDNLKEGIILEEGYISVGGKNIWYCVYGKEKEGTPVLFVHGGPGFSTITDGIRELSEDRPVYFYDQLGSMRSDMADSSDTYTVGYFVGELDEVRKSLGLDKVILMGHSWGGGLVAAYVLDRKPEGVSSLVLVSPFLSAALFEEDTRRNFDRLPEEFRKTIEAYDRDGNYGQEYQIAMVEYYKAYMCLQRPFPGVLMQAFGTMNEEVYGKLWGPSELKLVGTLRDFDLLPELGNLNLPVLIVGGDNDEVGVEGMRVCQLAIPNARLAVIPGAAHMNYLDQPELFRSVVGKFIREF